MPDYPIKEEYTRDVAAQEKIAEAVAAMTHHDVAKNIWTPEDIDWMAANIFQRVVESELVGIATDPVVPDFRSIAKLTIHAATHFHEELMAARRLMAARPERETIEQDSPKQEKEKKK